jgi:anti-sigma factor RsiW
LEDGKGRPVMSRCPFEDRIDAYLRNKLPADEAERFEEHYFNCPDCFRETAERSAFLEALRGVGEAPFRARPRPDRSWRWVFAAAAAAGVLAAGILFFPRPRPKPSPIEFSGDETVRGASLAVVGPAGALAAAPERLEWSPVPSAAEYNVALAEGAETLWTAETAETAALIPADVRVRLRSGATYVWRVRAYAAEGRMLAASDPTSFTIGR